MYFTPGLDPNELGDIEVVAHAGRLHVFYLSLPSHDTVGHIVSDDGIHWSQMPAAIRTGDPGDCDADHIWTMGVYRVGDTWHMLYTALSDRGRMQRCALATSPDLITWTKHADNPVVSADPRWYEAEVSDGRRVDWRDPHVVEHDGVLHGFIAARTNEGPLNRRGAAGHFTSTDGVHWTVTPPAYVASNCFDWEVPSVFRIGDRWYMVAIAGGCNRSVWRVAEDIEGPWRRPNDDGLFPGLNMAVRPCVWNGAVHLFHWQRGARDWGDQEVYRALVSPKLATVDANGDLVTSSCDWSAQYVGDAVAMTPDVPAVESCGTWERDGDALVAGGAGPAIRLFEQAFEDYELTADITLDADAPAREFGLVVRADDTGDRGLFASAVPGRYAAELVKYVHRMYPGDRLGRGRTLEQAYHLRPAADGRYRLRAVVHGPSIELNVNGRLVLAHMSLPRRAGRAGLFVEDGRARIENVTLQPIKPPTSNWE